jgi:O-antigen ligase
MNQSQQRPSTEARIHLPDLWPWLAALICLVAAVGWLLLAGPNLGVPLGQPQPAPALTSGVVARMDSPAFRYSDGWRLSPAGADPSEPGDAWNEPAGRVSFAYSGRELALQLAVGDYWSYIFVTVDGAPANRLANILGNTDSRGNAAGYKPLLAPERQSEAGTSALWVPVHSAADDGPHTVEVEVWRGWGQIPLRGVAVDALPAPRLPLWPAALFGLGAMGALYFALKNRTRMTRMTRMTRIKSERNLGMPCPGFLSALIRPIRVIRIHPWLLSFWPGALFLIGAGVFLDNWLLTDAGLALLALAAFLRPELWVAALLFGLPFYLYPLPILPGRGLNLIEIGVWGGLAILVMRNAECGRGNKRYPPAEAHSRREETTSPPTQYAIRNTKYEISNTQYLLLLLLWSLLSSLAAQYTDLALREWRTVLLAGGGFALLLGGVLAQSDDPARSRRVIVNAWLAGGTAVALIALWQFVSGEMLIQAEGVMRVRGLYGSPNNLALYLERTLAVGIGYWILGIGYCVLRIPYFMNRRERWIRNTQYPILLLPQLVALVLTFSKGALFLGFPAMLLVLGAGGAVLLARQGKSVRQRRSVHQWWSWRFLWWLAGIGGVVALGLLPFLGTERFRLLLDFGAGTTGGLRLNLWRSGWALALDHPWLGVGPDNFLYAYRSGYLLPAAWQDPNLNHPHNFVLDWWTRLGLPGLLLAGLWVGTGVRSLWRRLISGADAGLALGCLAAIAAALAHGLIDASFALPDLMLVWVLLLSVDKDPVPEQMRISSS